MSQCELTTLEEIANNSAMVPLELVGTSETPVRHETHVFAVMASFCTRKIPKGISSIGSGLSAAPHNDFQCMASFSQAMQPFTVFASRHMLDDMPHLRADTFLRDGGTDVPNGSSAFRQILPYSVLMHTQKNEDGSETNRYLTYQRGKFAQKATDEGIGEVRLEGKVSIGWGGHIEILETVQVDGVLNTSQTIYNGMMRELDEELALDVGAEVQESVSDLIFNSEIKDILLINSDASQVDKLHLGVTFVQRVSGDTPPNIVSNEAALKDMGWLTVEELRQQDNESWTAMLLDYLN